MSGFRLSREQRALVLRRRREGRSLREIAAEVGSSHIAVSRVSRRVWGSGERPAQWSPAPGRLTLAQREEISLAMAAGDTFTALATRLGRSVSTISREVGANGGRVRYRAWQAHQRAREQARRPKAAKLDDPRACSQVAGWLTELWSPKLIAGRLRVEFPDDPMMWVSHETIYKALFVQGRGELRRELARCLRSGRTQRRPQTTAAVPRMRDMVMISDRPAEVDDRAVPGHWEGDLILGKNSRSAVGTLVERSTRFVLLFALPDGRTADKVDAAMRAAIQRLPRELFRTLTWDQGNEMANHRSFTIDTGIDVYFCDPHSPWQRGSNEQVNGLLRQYMPKGTDLGVYSQDDLDEIARSLNNRPRETLGFLKPSEKLAELLALTA